MSRTKRVLLWIGGGLLGLILILFVTGIAIVRTDWFRSMVREKSSPQWRQGRGAGPNSARSISIGPICVRRSTISCSTV